MDTKLARVPFALLLVVGLSVTATPAGATASGRTAKLLSDSLQDGAPAVAMNGRMVFAHFLGVMATAGTSATVEGYMREMRQAQAAGIDGFGVDVAAWNDPNNSYYKNDRLPKMFQAAQELGTGFRLYLSIDMCCSLQPAEIVDMVRTYANHPNYYRYNGRPFLTTFIGEAYDKDWWLNNVLVPLRTLAYDVFFVPKFNAWSNGSTTTNYQDLLTAYNSSWRYTNDGFGWWGVAKLPAEVAAGNESYAQLSAATGKPYMAVATPGFWGNHASNAIGSLVRPYYEYAGGSGTQAIWESITNTVKPQWVEIETWNDLAEDTHLRPITATEISGLDPYFGKLAKPHLGDLAMAKYYIQWFKAGVQPSITEDSLFYSYRTHPKGAFTPLDLDGPVSNLFGSVEDVLYIDTMLTAPASVRVNTGGIVKSWAVGSGLEHSTAAFSPGTQSIDVIRGGRVLLHVQAEPILGTIQVYNFNKISGVAPGVSLTSPAPGATVPVNSAVTLAATPRDKTAALGIQKVEFLVDGARVCTATGAPYTCSWKVSPAPSKTYTISAVAYDNAGNSASGTSTVSAFK